MSITDVYAALSKQLNEQLPFVAYTKADSSILQVVLQCDDTKHILDEYTASGFIFAPFDTSKETIFIPSHRSETLHVDLGVYTEVETNLPPSFKMISDTTKDKLRHMQLVEKGIETITSSTIEKIVLSRTEEIVHADTFDALVLFKRLISSYPSAFVYFWYHPKVGTWLGATPETLLQSKNDKVATMSLAGTQPYESNKPIHWGSKEIEEQELVTRHILKTLHPVLHTITSSKTYTYRAGSLLHLRTDITGDIAAEANLSEIIKILHPTPAVCGLPTKEAQTFIQQHEGYDRKFYTGFLGELNKNENGETASNLFVNLRCMELKKNRAILYVGGGITKDSIPEKEWKETVKKTETMKKVLF
ncbi:isochorismate synthase [Aquimarina sp. U1-2]|uniref:isochorismate synthase n=1 Tax=Aquimarina sp. U1-2 TaxID=2823141 RepID=UPI001AEC8D8C|nr:isochorismate synthase [Aquimarina sp. U1-2]MBP2832668.1 isochorismate synthase [Aquimarina sp. U1-2]